MNPPSSSSTSTSNSSPKLIWDMESIKEGLQQIEHMDELKSTNELKELIKNCNERQLIRQNLSNEINNLAATLTQEVKEMDEDLIEIDYMNKLIWENECRESISNRNIKKKNSLRILFRRKMKKNHSTITNATTDTIATNSTRNSFDMRAMEKEMEKIEKGIGKKSELAGKKRTISVIVFRPHNIRKTTHFKYYRHQSQFMNSTLKNLAMIR